MENINAEKNRLLKCFIDHFEAQEVNITFLENK